MAQVSNTPSLQRFQGWCAATASTSATSNPHHGRMFVSNVVAHDSSPKFGLLDVHTHTHTHTRVRHLAANANRWLSMCRGQLLDQFREHITVVYSRLQWLQRAIRLANGAAAPDTCLFWFFFFVFFVLYLFLERHLPTRRYARNTPELFLSEAIWLAQTNRSQVLHRLRSRQRRRSLAS